MKLKENEKKLKRKLDYHYKFFDAEKIHPDPLEFPHRFGDWFDIEISAFLSSLFAYGNLKQITATLDKIHFVMGESPHKFITNYSVENKFEFPVEIKHRFFTQNDIHALFLSLDKIYNTYGSLKFLFLLYYFPNENNIKSSLSFFSRNLFDLILRYSEETNGIKFMFPDPNKGSACKRMNLFLRWMVRKDELDFGLWEEIPTNQLIIPVDTHVAKICRELKLTKRKNLGWEMAEEITEELKKFDSNDPVKYDFAICHIGMRKMKF